MPTNAEVYFVKHVIKIRAIKNIKTGDEITYHYGRYYFDAFIKAVGCKCMACARKKAKLRAERRSERRRSRPRLRGKAGRRRAATLAAEISDNQMAFMVREMAKKAGAGRKAGAFASRAPALIDPPFAGSLDDWLKFRAEMEELRRSGVPDVAPFIRKADREIARLRRAVNRSR